MEHNHLNKKLKLNNFNIFLLFLLIIGAFLAAGVYGVKVIGIILLFSFPFYLIISLFGFSSSEDILFALFISLAFFSLLVYWVNQIIYPYRISIVVSYAILILVYFGIKYFRKSVKD